jgi:hypothetical protein
VEAEEAEAGDGVELIVALAPVAAVAVVVMVGGLRAEPANGCGWLIAAEGAVSSGAVAGYEGEGI